MKFYGNYKSFIRHHEVTRYYCGTYSTVQNAAQTSLDQSKRERLKGQSTVVSLPDGPSVWNLPILAAIGTNCAQHSRAETSHKHVMSGFTYVVFALPISNVASGLPGSLAPNPAEIIACIYLTQFGTGQRTRSYAIL